MAGNASFSAQPDLRGLYVLVVDDAATVRQYMRSMLLELGVAKVEVATNVHEARKRMDNTTFDIIFCDYNLGTGMNGQEWLEELRETNRLGHRTGFIMITAEASYKMVAAAAEMAPDDYLLKPFTAAELLKRIEALFAKRRFLAPALRELFKGKPQEAIAIVRQLYEAGVPSAYYSDACRLLAELYEQEGRHAELKAFYDEVLAQRPLPWARLGRAKLMHTLGDPVGAESALNLLLRERPTFLAAHQAAADIHLTSGNVDKALVALEAAIKLSPNNVSRLRKTGELFLRKGDVARAAQHLEGALRGSGMSLGGGEPRLEFQIAMSRFVQGQFRDGTSFVQQMKHRYKTGEGRTYQQMADVLLMFARGHLDLASRQLSEVVDTLHAARADEQLSQDCLMLVMHSWGPKTETKLRPLCQRLVWRLASNRKFIEQVQDAIPLTQPALRELIEACTHEVNTWTSTGMTLIVDRKLDEAAHHFTKHALATGNSRLLQAALNACIKAAAVFRGDEFKQMGLECLNILGVELAPDVKNGFAAKLGALAA